MREEGTERAGVVAGALAGYVVLSSILGLCGFILMPRGGGRPGDALEFFVWVWSASLVADVFFVVGTAATGWWAYRLARERGVAWSVAAALVASWVVYSVSFMLLPADSMNMRLAEGFLWEPDELFWFTAFWGGPGLVFAALAPAVAWRLRAGVHGGPDPRDEAPSPKL